MALVVGRALLAAVAVAGDGDLEIHALISNTVAGTDPRGVGLRNNALLFAAVPVPRGACIGMTSTHATATATAAVISSS